jgi:hypothetical protein
MGIISFLPFSTQGKQPSDCKHHRSMSTWCIYIRQQLLIAPEHKSWPKQNDDKTAPNDKGSDADRSNDCHGPVFHSPSIFLTNSAATPGPNNTAMITA